jgi:hypothetical protein
MKLVIAGYARFLNKIARKEIEGDDYVIAIPEKDFRLMLILMRDAFNGVEIKSEPGKTYDDYTGTDITISTGPVEFAEYGDVLIPVHKNTVEFLSK